MTAPGQQEFLAVQAVAEGLTFGESSSGGVRSRSPSQPFGEGSALSHPRTIDGDDVVRR
jgi:hypothetical protein